MEDKPLYYRRYSSKKIVKTTDYVVAANGEIRDLETRVKKLLGEGYKPWGPMIWTGSMFCQPMIKNEKFKQED